MKSVIRLASLIVAVAVVLGVGRLWAENQAKKPEPRTRIGLLNLTCVIKNYNKYKRFQEEIKAIVEPFQHRDAKLRDQLNKLKAKNENGVGLLKKELEKKRKEIQRQLEDNSAEAKKILGKRSDDEMKILYKDVEEAVERYAAAHGLDLVLHYNDAVTKEDFYSARNIARKLNTGALMPLYMVSGIDISTEIVDDLNQRSPGGE
ncbi:MAG TPA: OmpH family outer membrane protein [Gemmataceae bacterium]|nr:OmpH family outer membrane protein [Gemmataceae bacterium]